MSIEPTCDYCGASDKNRCRSFEQATQCQMQANQERATPGGYEIPVYSHKYSETGFTLVRRYKEKTTIDYFLKNGEHQRLVMNNADVKHLKELL